MLGVDAEPPALEAALAALDCTGAAEDATEMRVDGWLAGIEFAGMLKMDW